MYYLAKVLHEERKLLPVHLPVPVQFVRLPNLQQLGIAQLHPRKLHQVVLARSPGPVRYMARQRDSTLSQKQQRYRIESHWTTPMNHWKAPMND